MLFTLACLLLLLACLCAIAAVYVLLLRYLFIDLLSVVVCYCSPVCLNFSVVVGWLCLFVAWGCL